MFSTVDFLRVKVTAKGTGATTDLAFVFGKARVAPIKALTIPKLELQGLFASSLRKEVQQALTMKINKLFIYTDCTRVLKCIHSKEKQPVFVANRIAEIPELPTTDEWNCIQSCDNPADAGTRGLSATALPNSIWLKGPDFLKTSDWPFRPSEHSSFKVKQGNDISSEEKPSFGDETVLNANAGISTTTFELHMYSSYEKLLRVAAYILRLLRKNEACRSITGAITDSNELKNVQMNDLILRNPI